MSRITYVEAPCKSVLNRVEGMPFQWSISPYAGCAHGCQYCYAMAFYKRSGRGSTADFSRVIYVKTNAPELLRRELARRSWKREQVLIGAATDPYQPGEARFRLTRRILEALRDFRTPVSLVTKGPLILRDLDVLRQIPDLEVHMSIPTMDAQVDRVLEPGTPPPAARMEAVRRLTRRAFAQGFSWPRFCPA